MRGQGNSITEQNPRSPQRGGVDLILSTPAAGSSPDLAASLSHRGLVAARAHAVLCGEVERCAPEVQSGYLRAAIERCKLPIKVEYEECVEEWWVWTDDSYEDDIPQHTAADATRAYLDLCRTLSTPDSPGNSAAGAVR